MTRQCPKYDQAFKEYVESAEIQSMLKSNKPLIKYVGKHSGERLRNFKDLTRVSGALFIEREMNFT